MFVLKIMRFLISKQLHCCKNISGVYSPLGQRSITPIKTKIMSAESHHMSWCSISVFMGEALPPWLPFLLHILCFMNMSRLFCGLLSGIDTYNIDTCKLWVNFSPMRETHFLKSTKHHSFGYPCHRKGHSHLGKSTAILWCCYPFTYALWFCPT